MLSATKSAMSVCAMSVSDTKPSTIRKLPLPLDTWMPCSTTASGSRDVASCSLFWVCTWAMSGSASGSNVSLICADPLLSLVEEM